MPTAPGALIHNSANRFTAIFVIDGMQRSYVAIMHPSVPPFSSNNVILTYNNVEELTGTLSHSGHIGKNDLALELENGVEIKGKLNQPGIDRAFKNIVAGSGSWE
ncbi:hypothetical protein FGLOB1_10191 [Fusarium globosum]|uniref:Uncharacterized protein n=1 Tax=Fusarium globosum TaxID=78864 RepID=A0A8H5XWB7_9HYPO|nr:hypothetical protein FGLOB1_10191 [Fusarium globosum]